MYTGLLHWICLALLCVASLPATAQAPQADEKERITAEVAHALWWGDFQALSRLHDQYSQPGQLQADGWPKLGLVRSGIDRAFRSPQEHVDAFYGQLQALTLQWAREHPRSGLAHALHAEALLDHAWAIRGTGFANTVPPQAWADFERLLRQAQAYLARHADAAQGSTLTHSKLLTFAMVGNWSERQLWAVIDDGLRRNPHDLDLYRHGLDAVLPKWGGDAAAVDRFIRRAVERTRDARGLSMYASLYSSAAHAQFEHRLFEESGASWAEMAQGWRDLLARHPAASTENRFAYFACLARDKTVFLELLDRIGEKPSLDQWGKNARRTFDTCKRWAGQL